MSYQVEYRCYEGCILAGPWGGPNGKFWTHKPIAPISQIVIAHGGAVDSLIFKSRSSDGSEEYSVKFGGKGGSQHTKIDFDTPGEYLTTISGTIGDFGGWRVVRSLCFYSNLSKYGPFGCNDGERFSCPMVAAVAVVFFGRAGPYLDASGCLQVASTRDDIMKMVVPRSPGPWGGSGGKQWDDGVFAHVKQIVVNVSSSGDAIHAVQFQYEKRDGKCVWSPMHGGLAGGDQIKRVNLQCVDGEFLVGISGFYGPLEGSCYGVEAIRAICFHTNKGIKYGPYGRETGANFTYFASSGSTGNVVGFHGRSDDYLSAIGVHMEFI